MLKKRKSTHSKTPKNVNQNSFLSKKKLAITILIFIVPILIVFATKYLDAIKVKEETNQIDKSTEFLMDKMKKMLDDEKNRLTSIPKALEEQEKQKFQKLPPVTTKEEVKEKEQEHFSEINDYKNSLDKEKKEKVEIVEKKVYIPKGKPKLAIIIDDVAYEHQTKLIKKIPFKVTPSFFPPTPRHPDTVSLAKEFKFAMVHLPMEALSYTRPEPNTLNVGDSHEVIQERIKNIKAWFPNINYYNNHTGSKYTADFASMDKLIFVLKSENITFVDSRTTAQTQVGKVFQKHNLNLLSRDVFLDNDMDKNAIKEQLKKAISFAKKHGMAIAIGHPHVNTLEVLRNSKSLLKDIDVVYVKDL